MTPAIDFGERIDRARGEMSAGGIDILLLCVGRDLLYLTGYEALPLERMTMAVVPLEGAVTLVVPELEAPRVQPRPGVFTIRPWAETEDPVEIVSRLAGSPDIVAIGDHTWASFVLGLQQRVPRARFIPAHAISAALRMRKSTDETALLRAAGAAADRVAVRLAEIEFAGTTEADLARTVARMIVEEGHEMAAGAIVASGPNGASPHHHPGERRITEGDAVVLDFGGTFGGYHSDTTRMFYVGGPTAEQRDVHDVVQEAQEVGFRACTSGTPAEEVDRATRAVIAAAGYGEYFVHRTGHGIGLDVHEEPYLVEGNAAPLGPGMAFSVEPGIYLPDRFGVRIEDIVVLGADGPERMNNSPRGPIVVG